MAPNSPPRKGERRNNGTGVTDDSQDLSQLPILGPVASQGQLPPPHNAPVTGSDRSHLMPPAPQTPFHTPMSQRGGAHHQGPGAVSPVAAESTSVEYFPTLGQASSRSSMRSGASAFSELDSPALPRQPAIRLRRRGGSGASQPSAAELGGVDAQGRPRSISQPERAHVGARNASANRHAKGVPQHPMPRLTEEGNRPTLQDLGVTPEQQAQGQAMPEVARTRSLEGAVGESQPGNMQRVTNFFRPRRTTVSSSDGEQASIPVQEQQRTTADDEYDAAIVDYLDTIDPEVQTLSALTNVQNSLFVPNLGSWLNRRPAYNLSAAQTGQAEGQVPNASAPPKPSSSVRPPQIPEGDEEKHDALDGEGLSDIQRNTTITSQLSETHYAALPHGETLQGWTEREKAELDDHVRHMLHSRRSKFKRSLKGFSQYVKQPLGFFVTLYATLITIFGLVWVLLIIGWISVSENDNEKKILHIVDSVLVALFAIVGDGMIPWRAMDTYHLCYIMYYVRIIRKARAKSLKKRSALEKAQAELKGLTTTSNSTQATDANGHPVPERRDSYTLANNIQVDIEDARSGINVYEDTPLTPEQQKRLYHHQSKLAKSHSFYRPNETNTHYAFPFNYAIAVIFLLDFHSFLQIALGATTWGIHYQTRHDAITTVILCVSITANIVTGFVITTGGKKTRKKAVWNLMTRQELTGDAIKHLEAKHERQAKKAERKTVAGASKQEKTLKVQLEKEARVQEESGVRADPWA